ncbi:MAG TPA: hypothetical protein VLV86_21745 [Vicinamibacterales bacterium]|nr:hypothetical protein [Vicinamibacterales bacterium]
MDPLDRELAEALNVDPSPAFVARVRARVASERPPARWRMSSGLAAAAAFVAVVGVTLWVTRVDRTPDAQGALGVMTGAPLHVQSPREMPQLASDESQLATTRRRRGLSEGLTAVGEQEGLRRLADLAREGRVVLTFEADTGDDVPAPIEDIVVAPILVEPLALASNSTEGDAQ